MLLSVAEERKKRERGTNDKGKFVTKGRLNLASGTVYKTFDELTTNIFKRGQEQTFKLGS